MSLELVYSVTPVPAKIYASSHSSSANAASVVDLHVSIAPPPGTTVSSLAELSISFGDSSEGGSLTDAPLPPPVPAPDPSLWAYDNTVDPPVLRPQAPVSAPLLYVLRDVVVNETPGDVAVKATEVLATGGCETDNVTTLTKLGAALVLGFSAAPAVISAVDQAVTLEWSVSPAAQGYLYKVRSDIDWTSAELQVNTSGLGSISSPQLSRTTEFWLDVIDSSSGSDQTISTSKLTVDLDVPEITSANATIHGLVATLRWTSVGATSCNVLIDGHVRITGAPPDTMANGFPAFLGVVSGIGVSVSLVAVSASGAMSPSAFEVGTLTPDAPTRLNAPSGPGAVTIGPASDRAYVAADGSVAVVDLAARQLLAPLAPTGDGAPSLNGMRSLAYVPGEFGAPDWLITVANSMVVMVQPGDPSKWFTSAPTYGSGQQAALTGPVGGSPGKGYAISWNSYGGSAPQEGDGYLWTYNTDTGTPQQSGGGFFLSATYFAPDDSSDSTVLDGQLTSVAVAAGPWVLMGGNDGTVILSYVQQWYAQVAGNVRVVTGATGTMGICGAGDGTVATFRFSGTDQLHRAGPSASLGMDVAAVGVTPDGAHGLAATADGSLHAIDTATGTVDPNSLNLGFPPADIAVSPNWPQGPVVVTGENGEILLL